MNTTITEKCLLFNKAFVRFKKKYGFEFSKSCFYILVALKKYGIFNQVSIRVIFLGMQESGRTMNFKTIRAHIKALNEAGFVNIYDGHTKHYSITMAGCNMIFDFEKLIKKTTL